MNRKSDGGSAFPAEGGCDSGLHAAAGMSLRQWYAGMALQGMFAADTPSSIIVTKDKAGCAFRAADAMIAHELAEIAKEE